MSDLNERLLQCQSIIDLVCREHRPLKMSIPVQGDDEDVILSNAIGDAAVMIASQQRDLDAARARIKELEDTLRFYGTPLHYVHDDAGVSIVEEDLGARAHAALSAKGGSDE